jgi:hypothetical protein
MGCRAFVQRKSDSSEEDEESTSEWNATLKYWAGVFVCDEMALRIVGVAHVRSPTIPPGTHEIVNKRANLNQKT